MALSSRQEKAENTEHTEIAEQMEFLDAQMIWKADFFFRVFRYFRLFRILSSANITVDIRRYMLTIKAMTGYATFILEM